MTKKAQKRMNFNPDFLVGDERFGFTSKKDLPPHKTDNTPPKYTFVVEWQLEVEVTKLKIPR